MLNQNAMIRRYCQHRWMGLRSALFLFSVFHCTMLTRFCQSSHFVGAPKDRIVQLWTDRCPTRVLCFLSVATCLAGFDEILTLQWGASRLGALSIPRPYQES